jgi:hypothetical protein
VSLPIFLFKDHRTILASRDYYAARDHNGFGSMKMDMPALRMYLPVKNSKGDLDAFILLFVTGHYVMVGSYAAPPGKLPIEETESSSSASALDCHCCCRTQVRPSTCL